MKYTKLGNSELNVSRICMGCMGFGNAKGGQHSWTLDGEHSLDILCRQNNREIIAEYISDQAFLDGLKKSGASEYKQESLLGRKRIRCWKTFNLKDTVFGAKASKYKNPINDVGVTQVWGIDDIQSVLTGTDIVCKKEHSLTPECPKSKCLNF